MEKIEKKKKNLIKFLNTGSSSSTYLEQNLLNKYPKDYNKNKLTQVSFIYKTIKVPFINKKNIYGNYLDCNLSSKSNYHLNSTLKTKFIKTNYNN